MMLVHTNPVLVGNFVIPRLPDMSRRTFAGRMDAFSALGYSEDGRMAMGVLFSDHSPTLRGVQVHLAMDSIVNPSLRTAFGHSMQYIFEQLKCVRATAHIPKRHHEMRKVASILGFTEEGCMKHGFLTDDCIVYGLTKRNAEKWMLHAEKNQHNLYLTGN